MEIPSNLKIKSELGQFEKIEVWRFYWDWLWSVVPLALMIFICEKLTFWAYPFCIYFLGNRIYRLATLGHEGLHGLISKSQFLNSFLARYFCHFPTFASHSRYKIIHALHHRYLGDEKDPDRYVYKEFPEPFLVWIKRIIKDLLTFKILYEFFEYYSEIPDRLRTFLGGKAKLLVLTRSDFREYLAFWAVIALLLSLSSLWKGFFIYWFIPLYFHLPLIQLANGAQHGAFTDNPGSRSQWDPWYIIDFFIPLDLNFHYEHHLNPRVPHYKLRAFAEYLLRSGLTKYQKDYSDQSKSTLVSSVKSIFRQ